MLDFVYRKVIHNAKTVDSSTLMQRRETIRGLSRPRSRREGSTTFQTYKEETKVKVKPQQMARPKKSVRRSILVKYNCKNPIPVSLAYY